MILRATQNVAPRTNFRLVIKDFANYVPILADAISHITLFYSVERPSVVKFLFGYPDVKFYKLPPRHFWPRMLPSYLGASDSFGPPSVH